MVLSWRFFLDRIPTRDNLRRWNIVFLDGLLACVYCEAVEESVNHLFLHCRVVMGIWSNLMRWLGITFLMPPILYIHWECWSMETRRKRLRKGFWVIWRAAIWVIWIKRNHRIFRNVLMEAEELVEEIKVLAWRWSLSWLNIPTCLYNEWC